MKKRLEKFVNRPGGIVKSVNIFYSQGALDL